jgi:uncharacterized membrane protein YqjE
MMAASPMADHPRPPEEAAGAVTTIGTTLVTMLHTRFELLRADLAEEHESLVAQVRLSVIAGVAGLLGAFTAVLTIAWSVPAEFRPAVLGGLALLLGGLSFWAFNLRERHRPRFGRPFSRLFEQLASDADALLGRPGKDPHEAP